MEQVKKHLAILNLTGEFIPELSDYFIGRGILVVDPLSCNDSYDWTHIITKDIHDFNLINKTYQISEDERNIISLTRVDDLQNFVLNNGNLVLDELWFKSELGGFILDKYFMGHAGINLKDNYPTFREIGSFNVANPFNTGEYLDKIVQRAFKEGMDGLSIKTYFDHLLMFLTGLKNHGKAGLPFEVTYGQYQEVFGIQIHFFAKNLELFDISHSLRSTLSKRPEEYYLNVAVQSSDFFEFSFLPEVDKAIVTALWTKDERIKYENRSFMMSSIRRNHAIVKYLTDDEDLSDFAEEQLTEDYSQKINLPDQLPKEVKEHFSKTFKEHPKEVMATTEWTFQQQPIFTDGENSMIGSRPELLDEDVSKVTGSPITKDEAAVIKSSSVLDELIQRVKEKVLEEKTDIKIAGEKIDIDKLVQKISSSYKETSEQMNLKIRSLGDKFPQTIKSSLFNFAKNLNRPINELNDVEIESFHLNTLADIIQTELVTSIIHDKDHSYEILKKQVVELKSTISKTKDHNEKSMDQFSSLKAENQALKERSLKLLRQQVQTHNQQKTLQPLEDVDEKMRKHFAEKLSNERFISEEDMKNLSSLLLREVKLVSDLRNEEMKTRKLAIESANKEFLLSQEIQDLDKKVREKEIVAQKTKEVFTRMIDKKDQEVNELRAKLLSGSAILAPSKSQTEKITDLEKQNQNLYRQIEKYKQNITTMSSTIQALKSDDGSKDDRRKIVLANLQLKNQVSQYERELEKIKTKASKYVAQLVELREEKLHHEELLKRQSFENKKGSFLPQGSDKQLADLNRINESLENQLKDYESKILHLESQLSEAQRPAKLLTASDEPKVKITQLETSLKKLSQDNIDLKNKLDDSKRELNKLRQEKTALQNLSDKLKKDAEKAKPVVPKKPGNKVA